MNRQMRHQGFTLLEAVLAISILASVMIVTLSMRAASLRQSDRLAAIHQADRELITLFELLRSGMLGDPQVDPETGLIAWSGEHLGRPYAVIRNKVVVRNPDHGVVAAEVAEQMAVFEYQVTYGGERQSFYWFR